jgi:hypothetical protein
MLLPLWYGLWVAEQAGELLCRLAVNGRRYRAY